MGQISRVKIFVWIVLLLLGLAARPAEVLAAAKTKAGLVLSHEVAGAGETVTAAVRLEMAPRWHTYWRNSGESGAPTKLEWVLPTGISAGEIQWPVPEKYVVEGLTTYVHHDEIFLLVPLQIGAEAAKGAVEIKAKVSWLECEVQCIPGSANVSASLVIGDAAKLGAGAAVIAAARKRLPETGAAVTARAAWDGAVTGKTRAVVIEWKPRNTGARFDFFPDAAKGFEVLAATEVLKGEGAHARLRKVIESAKGGWPERVSGLLVELDAKGKALAAFEVGLPIANASAGAAAVAPGASAPPTGAAVVAPTKAKVETSLFAMLGLAFIGGLILNIMPCVLPVIALKILGFVNQSREAPGRVRQLGLVYGLGVLCSFLVLAGMIIGVQRAGRDASWGMQFQNPQFLVAITTLVVLVALNLFGVFEVSLGGTAMGAAGNLAAREGASGAFFNGVLATILATPCSAPFLGFALGFAFTQPPLIIVLMFLTVGCGLALPYVVLSWEPGWLKFLPKPGAWMEKFKNVMGFPMLATAVWLFSIAENHYGKRGVLWFGLFLVVLALALWIWGEFVQRGSRRRGLAMALSAALAGGGFVYAMEIELQWRAPIAAVKAGGSLKESPDGIDWQPWSAGAVTAARAAGRPVFVDFTADWCVTCQANKKTSIEIAAVRAKLQEINAVALLGDYTREDPAIAAELKRFGRAAVPLVVVFPRDASAAPMVLPEVLTPGLVLGALDSAAK